MKLEKQGPSDEVSPPTKKPTERDQKSALFQKEQTRLEYMARPLRYNDGASIEILERTMRVASLFKNRIIWAEASSRTVALFPIGKGVIKAVRQWAYGFLPVKEAQKLVLSAKAAKQRARTKSWERALGDLYIARWAWDRIKTTMKDTDPCCDNARCARKDSPSGMRRFKKLRKSGCCGSHEWEERGPDGKLYVLGFNYGH